MKRSARPLLCPPSLGISLSLVVGACAGASAPPRKAEPTLLERVKATRAGAMAGSRWIYHPEAAAALFDGAPLGEGGVVMAGARGERWVVRREEGSAEVSSWVAPETLVAVSRGRERWFFIGAEGTSYEAEEPLGPLVTVRVPPEALRVVASRGGAAVGITARGGLVASADAAQSWVVVGPASERFADVSVDGSGRGLALATPESLWAADPVTGSWGRLEAEPFGAQRVEYHQSSGLVVEGVLGRFSYSPSNRTLSPLARGIAEPPLVLGVPVPAAPSATAIGEGRAALDGEKYVELRGAKEKWRLLYGRLSEPLAARTARALDGCGAVRLASKGDRLVVVCGAQAALATLQQVKLYTSVDGGRRWAPQPQRLRGMMAETRVAIGSSGDVLLSGICPPHESSAGCLPRGVYWYRYGQKAAAKPFRHSAPSRQVRRAEATPLTAAALPGLSGVADAILMAEDGRHAYVIGRRTKTGQYAAYASDESGLRFSVKDLGPLPPPFLHAESESDGQQVRRDSMVQGAAVGQDGSLSVLFAHRGDQLLVVTDSKGEVRTIGRPPEEAGLLAASGSRVLALDPATGRAWESSDGGVSWAVAARLPTELCPGDSNCSLPFVCAQGGCLVADEWTRFGWGAAPNAEGSLPARPSAAPTELELGPTWTCQLDDRVPWRRIDGTARAPRADDAAMGGASWYVVAADSNAASASVSVLRRGHATPDVETLLARSPTPEHHALYVSHQVEGAAALRYRIPESGAPSTKLRGVEVAWLNLFTGKKVVARLADAGAFRPGDATKLGEHVQRANPNLLSIAGDGLFLRVHAVSTGSQPTLFLDGQSVTELPAVVLSVPVSDAHHDMARVDGESVALVMTNSGVVMRGSRDGSAWRWSALSLMLPDGARFQVSQTLDITYLGNRPALHVLSTGSACTTAAVYPLQREGAVVGEALPAPTLADLRDADTPCSEDLRRTTPRLIAPAEPHSRFPVLIREGLEPERVLVSGRAVLHGSPGDACVAAIEAGETTDPFDGRPLTALFFPGDLGHAWAFRSTGEGDAQQVEFRAMACRQEPDLRLPAETLKELRMRLGAPRRSTE